MPNAEKREKWLSMLKFWSPQYWPTWLLIGFMKLVSYHPFALQIKFGKLLGYMTFYLAKSRRHICEVNLKLCYPELKNEELQNLVKRTFISNGIGLIETAIVWHRDPNDFKSKLTVSGLENLKDAVADGRGVLLICAHFTTLEIGGFLLSLFQEMDVTYRPFKNCLFDHAMLRGRSRHYPSVIDRKDIRSALKSLKKGNVIWYAPDQDYGPKHSVFVPFFGVNAATITATARIADFNNSAVIFFSHYRKDDDSGYELRFSKKLENYPTGESKTDASIINKLIENAIRERPEQYLWLHRRFKTQAAGKSARPY